MILENLDEVELNKIKFNRMIFKIFKTDRLQIEDSLKILGLERLPLDIPIGNNLVFIRDISNYLVKNKLEPQI